MQTEAPVLYVLQCYACQAATLGRDGWQGLWGARESIRRQSCHQEAGGDQGGHTACGGEIRWDTARAGIER